MLVYGAKVDWLLYCAPFILGCAVFLPFLSHGALLLPAFGGLIVGDHPESVGDHAPAHPAFYPGRSMIPAPLQPLPAFEPCPGYIAHPTVFTPLMQALNVRMHVVATTVATLSLLYWLIPEAREALTNARAGRAGCSCRDDDGEVA